MGTWRSIREACNRVTHRPLLAVHRKGSSIRIQLAFEKRVPVKPVRLSRMTLFSRACAFGVDIRAIASLYQIPPISVIPEAQKARVIPEMQIAHVIPEMQIALSGTGAGIQSWFNNENAPVSGFYVTHRFILVLIHITIVVMSTWTRTPG